MKTTIIIIIAILILTVKSYALDYTELSDNWLTEVYRLNKQLVSTQQELLSTQQELETAVSGEIERDVIISQQQVAITELNSVLDLLQGNIHDLNTIIENQSRHHFGDMSLNLFFGAGTGITGQVEGRLYLGSGAFLFIQGGIDYPYMWDRTRVITRGNAGLGYLMERER